MTHDDGVRWLASELLQRLEPMYEGARLNYLEAQNGGEEEYFRGQRDALGDVMDLLGQTWAGGQISASGPSR